MGREDSAVPMLRNVPVRIVMARGKSPAPGVVAKKKLRTRKNDAGLKILNTNFPRFALPLH
jgi:hypothetical protein